MHIHIIIWWGELDQPLLHCILYSVITGKSKYQDKRWFESKNKQIFQEASLEYTLMCMTIWTG